MAPADYIALGLRPIPVHAPETGCHCDRAHVKDPQQCHGKVPSHDNWADRPPFQAHEFPACCNVALAMGRQPDGRWLLGIDVDGEVDLRRAFGCDLPDTLETSTGRGEHYIYQVRDAADFGNWVDVFSYRDKDRGYKPGYRGAVDLRYARGALVVAPSRHRSGVQYQTTLRDIARLPPAAAVAIYAARKKRGLPIFEKWHGFREGKCP